jgi:cytochrome o ubiquinol oxidase subunit 2
MRILATLLKSLVQSSVFRRSPRWLALAGLLPLSGCSAISNAWFFHPNGPIASGSLYYLMIDLGMLMLIIIPTTALVLWAVYRYRRGGRGTYNPKFAHSNVVEFFAWGIPILLVGGLAYFVVEGTQDLDPYHPAVVKQYMAAQNDKPLRINVITTDWQWLFIYPQQGVALSNKLMIPVNRKIHLHLTSASVTNDFYIQKLVGQIYIMPGMRTQRTFVAARPGAYQGYSAQMSGPGFSWMRYKAHIVTPKQFKKWVKNAKSSGQKLTYKRFKKFARPTINTGFKSTTFSGIEPHLFDTVIHRVRDGQLTHYRPMKIAEDEHSEMFKQHSN